MAGYRKFQFQPAAAEEPTENISSFSNFSRGANPGEQGENGASLAALATLAGGAVCEPQTDAAAAPYATAPYDLAERVAIVVHDAGIPEEWAEGFAKLDATRPPSTIMPRDWLNMVNGAGQMLDRFGVQLSALGWSVADLFGVHPEAPMQRHDCGGLARFLADGSEVVAVTADTAILRNRRGNCLTYYRRPAPTGTACLWELAR